MKYRTGIGFCLLFVAAGALPAETIVRGPDGVFIGERIEQSVAMKAGQKLTVKASASLSGNLKVTVGGGVCRVVYQKRLKAESRSVAAEYAGEITVEAAANPEGVAVSLTAPNRAAWSGTNDAGRVEVEITIPEGSDIVLATAYFDINAIGPFREVMITESLSKVDVENVTAGTEIKVANRPLTVKHARGRLAVTNQYAGIKLVDVYTGDETGLVSNDNGEVVIESYRGGIDVRTSNDRIFGQRLFLTGSKNRVKNTSGPIALAFDSLTTGKFRIANQFGAVTITIAGRTNAAFICRPAEASRVMADQMSMEPTLVYDNRLEFTTGGGEAEVRITTKEEGNIIITGSGKAVAGGASDE